jgi:hypothetical protein
LRDKVEGSALHLPGNAGTLVQQIASDKIKHPHPSIGKTTDAESSLN